MIPRCEVRRAETGDASAISAVILSALRSTSFKDYPPNVIRRIEECFSPSAVNGMIAAKTVLVAVAHNRILGTASLDGSRIRTVYVTPDAQRIGVGRCLFQEIERTARDANIACLVVASSVDAEPFFASLGFVTVRDSYYGKERSIVMERPLALEAC